MSEESLSGKVSSESGVAVEVGGGRTLPHPPDCSDHTPGHCMSLSFLCAERRLSCALTRMLKSKHNLA